MTGVVVRGSEIEVDAELLAEGLQLTPQLALSLLRDGHIASRCERGEEADAGTFRLTFVHDRRRLQLIVDADGRVLERSVTVHRAHARGAAR